MPNHYNRSMLPTHTIDLIDADDSYFAQPVRTVLEYYGIRVEYHPIGEAKDLVAVLSGAPPLSDCVLIACHGVKRGLCLPELAPRLECKQPYRKVLTPGDLREFLRLPDCLVINTGCLQGTPAFAKAFLNAGCHTYIGATDDPDGHSALFYAIHFFYELHCRGKTVCEAHQLAAGHDSQTRMFKLYERKRSRAERAA